MAGEDGGPKHRCAGAVPSVQSDSAFEQADAHASRADSDKCLIRHGKKRLEKMPRINGDVATDNAWKCSEVAALEAG